MSAASEVKRTARRLHLVLLLVLCLPPITYALYLIVASSRSASYLSAVGEIVGLGVLAVTAVYGVVTTAAAWLFAPTKRRVIMLHAVALLILALVALTWR